MCVRVPCGSLAGLHVASGGENPSDKGSDLQTGIQRLKTLTLNPRFQSPEAVHDILSSHNRRLASFSTLFRNTEKREDQSEKTRIATPALMTMESRLWSWRFSFRLCQGPSSAVFLRAVGSLSVWAPCAFGACGIVNVRRCDGRSGHVQVRSFDRMNIHGQMYPGRQTQVLFREATRLSLVNGEIQRMSLVVQALVAPALTTRATLVTFKDHCA